MISEMDRNYSVKWEKIRTYLKKTMYMYIAHMYVVLIMCVFFLSILRIKSWHAF